jgi:hypothetical protein
MEKEFCGERRAERQFPKWVDGITVREQNDV